MSRKIVAGNWKMNLDVLQARALYNELNGKDTDQDVRVILCPPAVYLSEFSINIKEIHLAAQNVSDQSNGAYTGEISAEMLNKMGVDYCLVGHSERRLYNGETNDLLYNKIKQLIKNNVHPIYCCGESLEERESGKERIVIQQQLKEGLFSLSADDLLKCVIAYEPIWAIGTGKTATSGQAQEMHAFIRQLVEDNYNTRIAQTISILYGGSCKPDNVNELFSKPDVDGGLIGGASLDANSFKAIIDSF